MVLRTTGHVCEQAAGRVAMPTTGRHRSGPVTGPESSATTEASHPRERVTLRKLCLIAIPYLVTPFSLASIGTMRMGSRYSYFATIGHGRKQVTDRVTAIDAPIVTIYRNLPLPSVTVKTNDAAGEELGRGDSARSSCPLLVRLF